MQAVILAAGKGVRMGNLTELTPKPLLEVGGKTLLDYKLEVLPKAIDEVVFVVGYLGDKIRSRYGKASSGRKIIYAEDSRLAGTAEALRSARVVLRDKFLVMMGDDIYLASDLEKMVKEEWALGAVSWCNNSKPTATVYLDNKGMVRDIVEAVSDSGCRFVNAGLYTLKREFLDTPPVIIPGRSEYGLPQTLAKHWSGVVKVVPIKDWFPVTKPDDLTEVGDFLKKHGLCR